jgi:hypothetical protein
MICGSYSHFIQLIILQMGLNLVKVFLIKKMLKKNAKAGILNEENFDEIETQLENNEE